MIDVIIYATGNKPDDTNDDHVGRAHSRCGFPVAIHITRNNQRHTLHLSWHDARELQEQLTEARMGGKAK